MIRTRTASAVLAIFFLPALCRPQVPDVSPLDGYTAGQVQQGGPSGSYALSNLETLNTANGQLSITIPLVTVHGRGSVSVPLSVNLAPPIWDVTANSYEYDCGEYSCTIGWLYTMTAGSFLMPTLFNPGEFVFRSSGDECVPVNSSSSRWNNVLTRGTFVAADGTETEFVDEQTNGTPEPGNLGYNRGTVFLANNGSMTKFTASASVTDSSSCTSSQTTYPSGTLVMRDGTQYTITNGGVTKIEDHNGNYTAFANTSTDSLGRPYLTGLSGNTGTVQYYGVGGGSRTITVHYAPLSSVLASGQSVETYNQLWSIGAGLQNGTQEYDPPGMVSEIDLPDGSKYSFTYDSYGEVAQMTLPTGDYIQYSYTSQASAGETSPGSVDLLINGQEVSTTVPSAYMYALGRSLEERRVYVNGAYVGKMDFPSTSEIDWYSSGGNLLAKQTQTIASAGTPAQLRHELQSSAIQPTYGRELLRYERKHRARKRDHGVLSAIQLQGQLPHRRDTDDHLGHVDQTEHLHLRPIQ